MYKRTINILETEIDKNFLKERSIESYSKYQFIILFHMLKEKNHL